MSYCIRCKKNYRELDDEQGDHDCPHCGLTPEVRQRSKWRYENGHWTDEPEEE